MIRSNQNLYLVYSFVKDNFKKDFKPFYRVITIFGDDGELDLSDFEKENDEPILEFLDKQEMATFVEKVIENNKAESLYMLSSHDYNTGIEVIKTKDQVFSLFEKFGTEVNAKEGSEKGSFFGRFF